MDALVQDSVPALRPGDRVESVEIRFGEVGEVVEPDSVGIEPGDWVDFRTDDGSPRLVRFALEEMNDSQRAFLDERGAAVSPPLVAVGAHWVVSFIDAPPGRYPFRVEGARGSVRGVVQVGGTGV
ncbi:MAG: hypothetical protein P8188_07625 [Gemmatimonadota bacterium]